MSERQQALEDLLIARGWMRPPREVTLTGPADVWLSCRDQVRPPHDVTFFADDNRVYSVTVTLDVIESADVIATLKAEGFRRE